MASKRVLTRAAAYIAACPVSVQGKNGSAALYRVCCSLTHGFCLDEADAREVLEAWNERCEPPWSDDELEHAIQGSLSDLDHQKPYGHLLDARRQRRRRRR